jgi:hypothetical protein
MNAQLLIAVNARLALMASLVGVPEFSSYIDSFIKAPKSTKINYALGRECRVKSSHPRAKILIQDALMLIELAQAVRGGNAHKTRIEHSAARSVATFAAKRANDNTAPSPEMSGKRYRAREGAEHDEKRLQKMLETTQYVDASLVAFPPNGG